MHGVQLVPMVVTAPTRFGVISWEREGLFFLLSPCLSAALSASLCAIRKLPACSLKEDCRFFVVLSLWAVHLIFARACN